MYRALFLFVVTLIIPSLAQAGSAYSGNTIDDMFTVKSLEGNVGIAEGKVKGLKAGDMLYYPKDPYKFKILEVKGNQVTFDLTEGHQLEVGKNLLRNETGQMKKSQDTESRLKQALED